MSSGTRPLQIRPTRPITPSNSRARGPAASDSPTAPTRPDRSTQRPRQTSDYATSDATPNYRFAASGRERKDSTSTSRSDASLQYVQRTSASSPPIPTTRPLRRENRSKTTNAVVSNDVEAPNALAAAMSAFQSAGARKRTLDLNVDDEWEQERLIALEAEQRRQKKIQDKVPGRRTNGRAKAGDIDAVLDAIKDEWEFVIDPDFNPVDLALQILDDSPAGKDMTSFRRTKKMLSYALKGSVDKHYQAFDAALPLHASLVTHLTATQDYIKNARFALLEAKDTLGNKRSDLVQLWTRSQTLEEMIRILDRIERLKLVPDVLESLISEKRLLQAANLLVQSLKTVKKQDMMDIGAVSDLRNYLIGQELALREILVDEIHSHLYLKSFWCEQRWAAYRSDRQYLPNVDHEVQLHSNYSSSSRTFKDSGFSQKSRLALFIHELALRPNDPVDILVDSDLSNPLSNPGLSSNTITGILGSSAVSSSSIDAPGLFQSPDFSDVSPESNSFTYLEMLLESLTVLGKLGNGLDIIAQRLPNEIFALIESTVDEVGERIEYNRRASLIVNSTASMHSVYFVTSYAQHDALPSTLSLNNALGCTKSRRNDSLEACRLRLTALESSAKQSDHEILRDLFWTIFSKLDAVLQGLRVVYEVANRISSRRNFKESPDTKPVTLFPLPEMWLPIQAEIRTLLYDYITDEGQGTTSRRNPISSINDVLRDGRLNRDKSKYVFRFADTDTKSSTKVLRSHEDELNRALRDTVPGLVSGSSETSLQATLSSVGSDENLLGIEQHHRLLIKPDASHVSVLFQPTLAFLDRVAVVLPSGSESARAFRAVTEEFVLGVYLPQLDEKVSSIFHQSISSPEAFQPDHTSAWLSKQPLINASTTLLALVNSLSTMLINSPFHRDNYARFILTVIIQFYQRCSDRFQSLVSMDIAEARPDTKVALAAQWSQTPGLAACLSQLFDTPGNSEGRRYELCRQENALETTLLGDNPIDKEDLISPTGNITALGHLYHSLTWFIDALSHLGVIQENVDYPKSPLTAGVVSAVTPQTPYAPLISREDTTTPFLSLSREMAMRFQALLKTYEQLAEFIIYTIRIDVRCRIIYYLDLATHHGNYNPDREVGEPDPHIIDLNLELGMVDEMISKTILEPEQRFIFDGIGMFMEELLVSMARNIRKLNDNGVKKMTMNILALQQCVKAITHDSQDTSFERAKQYWSLFALGPNAMLDNIRLKRVFTLNEYKTMLDLQCGIDPTLDVDPASQASDRNYSMYVVSLHGLELEDEQIVS